MIFKNKDQPIEIVLGISLALITLLMLSIPTMFPFSSIYNNYHHEVLAFKLTQPPTSTSLPTNQPNVSTVPHNQTKANVANEYVLVRTLGSNGSGDGQFYGIFGIAFDSTGNMYVADVSNDRVQKFDSNGKFITKWGSQGTGDEQFFGPIGIALDPSGSVYVADVSNDRVQKFDSNGKFITKWGSHGTGIGQFINQQGIAVDPSGNVYVADADNNRVQKFDSNGKFITKWGSRGNGEGEFINPNGIALDHSSNVYVTDSYHNDTDSYNNRIQKFDSNGKFITKWGSRGTGDGQFNLPIGIALDPSGNVYVVDSQNDRVQKFDSNGKFMTKIESANPNGIALDSSGNVYIGDILNDRVQVYAPSTNSSK